MKYILLFFTALFFLSTAGAQSLTEKLNSLVENEYQFAKLVKERSNKFAFLEYSNDKTILFTGSGIASGKKFWEERKEDSTLYTWYPTYAGISAAGDMGFTSGPSAFYRTRKKDEKAFYGAYISVWEKQNGKWLMALDIGVYPQPAIENKTSPIQKLSTNSKSNSGKAKAADMLKAESDFIKSRTLEEKMKLVSDQANFYRIQKQVLNQRAQVSDQIKGEIETVEYTISGQGISSSGDLGYVYGTAKMKAGDKITPGYFVRIWKLDNEWTVVLDVLTD